MHDLYKYRHIQVYCTFYVSAHLFPVLRLLFPSVLMGLMINRCKKVLPECHFNLPINFILTSTRLNAGSVTYLESHYYDFASVDHAFPPQSKSLI